MKSSLSLESQRVLYTDSCTVWTPHHWLLKSQKKKTSSAFNQVRTIKKKKKHLLKVNGMQEMNDCGWLGWLKSINTGGNMGQNWIMNVKGSWKCPWEAEEETVKKRGKYDLRNMKYELIWNTQSFNVWCHCFCMMQLFLKYCSFSSCKILAALLSPNFRFN